MSKCIRKDHLQKLGLRSAWSKGSGSQPGDEEPGAIRGEMMSYPSHTAN